MIITEEIRNYEFHTVLQREKVSTSREFFALAVLKYSFPEKYSRLRKLESPDLQDIEGQFGIEVTFAGNERDEQISGESIKFNNAKTEEEKEKCLRIIRENGGDLDYFTVSYPFCTADDDKHYIQNAFVKKISKIDRYRKKFKNVGIALIVDIPIFLYIEKDWRNWLSSINKGAYDFVVIIHEFGIIILDFATMDYLSTKICREDMEALKKIGRLTAEDFLNEDSPIWKE